MLIDEVEISIKAGNGGMGKVSFFKKPMRGPDGGNGGRGGNVYITVTEDITALNRFSGKKEFMAEGGFPGGSNRKTGRNGKNIILVIPVSTTITNLKTKECLELTNVGQQICFCHGGKGGKGNWEFRSPTNTTPRFAQKGEKGEQKHVSLSLRLIADFGLIGLPNSGKSSLLNELTAAKAKIASYPFTTLEPNLGALNNKILADIPGLIEGAHLGKGLGIKFLKHIEKVKLLLHCLSLESQNLMEDYNTVRNEMRKFNKALLDKPEVILLTKTDLLNKNELNKKIKLLKSLKITIITTSIYDWDSINKIKKFLGR